MRRLAVVIIGALVLLVSACTGIPTNSVPQVVKTVDGATAGPTATAAGPVPNADPRSIVDGFLQANVSSDEKHPDARLYLTSNEATKWTDNTAKIVDDLNVGVFSSSSQQVIVTGRIIGTLDEDGAYAPAAAQQTQTPFTFHLVSDANGQWRIDQPPSGLIISRLDFVNSYHARPLYFFNQDETKLVPDLRYSAAAGQTLASWMLSELINGPAPLTAQTPSPLRNEFPDQIAATSAKITLGNASINIQLPGIMQADAGTISRVAAELAYTFDELQTRGIEIFDGTTQVVVPDAPAVFRQVDFDSVGPLPATIANPFYLRNYALMDSAGKPVAGAVGTDQYRLTSVAVAAADTATPLVAGTNGSAAVLVGTPSHLSSVPLPTVPTSRPDWSRGSPRAVWIGAGAQLLEVSGQNFTQIQMYFSEDAPLTGYKVSAVRFSPEGARIALVLKNASGASLWIGQLQSVDHSQQVVGLRRISPASWVVGDVGWSDPTSLLVSVTDPATQEGQIWSLQVDGSVPNQLSVAELPGPEAPKAIAVAPSVAAWVGISGTVWKQAQPATEWVSPFGRGSEPGSAPTYASP